MNRSGACFLCIVTLVLVRVRGRPGVVFPGRRCHRSSSLCSTSSSSLFIVVVVVEPRQQLCIMQASTTGAISNVLDAMAEGRERTDVLSELRTRFGHLSFVEVDMDQLQEMLEQSVDIIHATPQGAVVHDSPAPSHANFARPSLDLQKGSLTSFSSW